MGVVVCEVVMVVVGVVVDVLVAVVLVALVVTVVVGVVDSSSPVATRTLVRGAWFTSVTYTPVLVITLAAVWSVD
jgi:hypothetical protein